MQIATFRCPHCSADLKMRGDEFVDRSVDCPDCRKPMIVRRGTAGGLLVEKPGAPPAKGPKVSALTGRKPSRPADAPSAPPAEPAATPSTSSTLSEKLRSPQGLWWTGGTIATVAVLAIVFWLGSPRRATPPAVAAHVPEPAPSHTAAPPVQKPAPKPAPSAPTRPAATRTRVTAIVPLAPAAVTAGKNVPASPPANSAVGHSSPATKERLAMADPMNTNITPIPSDSRSPAVAARPFAKPKRPAAAAAKPVHTIDIAAGLRQPIVRFEQAKAVPLRDVLNTLEEMLGVPIRGDKLEISDLDDLLQTAVTFDLKNTTVSDVLKDVLAQAKLTFEVEADAIRLRKLAAASSNGSLH